MLSEKLLTAVPEWSEIKTIYQKWVSFMEAKVVFSLAASPIHTKQHCERVILYALILAQQSELGPEDLESLGAAGAFHDCRRHDDGRDKGHGGRAAAAYKEYCQTFDLTFDERTYVAMAYHDQDDSLGEAEMRKRGLPNGVLLYQIFKDADALDRWRLGPHDLKLSLLRTPGARPLADFSRQLVRETTGLYR